MSKALKSNEYPCRRQNYTCYHHFWDLWSNLAFSVVPLLNRAVLVT